MKAQYIGRIREDVKDVKNVKNVKNLKNVKNDTEVGAIPRLPWWVISIWFLIMPFCASNIMAQSKLQQSAGGYHGELDFPWSWKRYYTYAEWTQMMKDIAKKYPDLAFVESIGKSQMGRDQYLITITNKNNGDHSSKTAMWVDGAIHGNEVNGINCSLYLMWYLLTRYDYDPYVFNMVNDHTFYILPGLNVDANASYVEYPNTENNPREPYRPEDNDGDGLYDEDRTEDVDGDGELSIMYAIDPKGDLKLSPDKRRFVSIGEEKDYPGLRFRRIGEEGFDNDGDGRINEDDIGGPDPNRNYAYGWNLRDGNPYPMSEPCTRNAYNAMLARPNIFASFHYHNTGRLIMFTAPQALPQQPSQPSQQGGFGQRGNIQERLAELRKTDKYAQLFDRQVAPEFQHDLDVQTSIVTAGARILKDYTPTFSGLSGQAQAASYNMLGNYGYLIELWGDPVYEADLNGDKEVSEDEYMKWIDIELTGDGWIKPHPFKHPDLGEIWIGGSGKKHVDRTPPSRYIETEADRNAHFVMYCVNPDRSKKLERIKKDKLLVSASDNIQVISLNEKLPLVDPTQGFRNAPKPGLGKETELWLKGNDSQTFRYLIKKTGGKGWLEAEIISEGGGKDKKKIPIDF
ncbi:MAG: M14 family metallopeptidase [Bacteroidia bacterium]|nr:M14 family metallopeptidase [Bacteroidia bacterium]